MRWLALVVVMTAAALAFADPPATSDPPASSGSDDLASLTKDPVLGNSGRVNGRGEHGIVAFTFDDGPDPATTPAVIDALEKYDVPATFFVVTRHLVGKRGIKGREVLQRELAGGFLIGSHTATHKDLRTVTGPQLTHELDDSFRILAREAKRTIALFRPPYGKLSGAGRSELEKLGVTEVTWSVDSRDWQAKDARALRKQVMQMILRNNGGIVLMHDTKAITAKIIGAVLDDLEVENCKRLDHGGAPIVPVSIHYFLRDGAMPRAVPAEVQKRTEAYKLALPVRCANRRALRTVAR